MYDVMMSESSQDMRVPEEIRQWLAKVRKWRDDHGRNM